MRTKAAFLSLPIHYSMNPFFDCLGHRLPLRFIVFSRSFPRKNSSGEAIMNKIQVAGSKIERRVG
ncbi:MAG: hypothetical protein AMJ94_08645 [Deltaproteobacteria bacterium SM23_61]|nr:MAG: hypothetical protein AMJ94_08645 [Deltaproteobacteria bacterium SM23_61]